MEKMKVYNNACFSADVIKSVLSQHVKGDSNKKSFRIRGHNESWEFDEEIDFFPEYRREHESSTIRKSDANISITINYTRGSDTTVIVNGKTRGEIESVFEIFEEKFNDSVVEHQTKVDQPIVFVGHGGSPLWRDLKDHLSDKHNYKIEAYETGARSGHTIRDILDEMATKSSFAILVMTGEDESTDGTLKARPNVIHEIGLFQGRLGFSRAVILLEEGTEEFSNINGIQQLRFAKGNIKEVFGDVLATLKREFEIKK